jgi:hypothetical protein
MAMATLDADKSPENIALNFGIGIFLTVRG